MVKITAKVESENKVSKTMELKPCEMAYIVGMMMADIMSMIH